MWCCRVFQSQFPTIPSDKMSTFSQPCDLSLFLPSLVISLFIKLRVIIFALQPHEVLIVNGDNVAKSAFQIAK